MLIENLWDVCGGDLEDRYGEKKHLNRLIVLFNLRIFLEKFMKCDKNIISDDSKIDPNDNSEE